MKTKKRNKLGTAILAVAVLLMGFGNIGHATDVNNAAPKMNGQLEVVRMADEDVLYTGKPYDKDLGTYAFNYRYYHPEFSRWTSADPSGFPDGANQNIYAPSPTNDLDVGGLLKWSTLINKGTSITEGPSIVFDEWTVETNDGSAVIDLWKYSSGAAAGTDWTYNCHGFTFGNSQYWINGQFDAILLGDGYTEITGTDKTGAKVAWWGGNIHTAKNIIVPSGTVTSVTGKRGATVNLTISTPAGQGYSGTIRYYE